MLLDHGLYHKISEDIRLRLCRARLARPAPPRSAQPSPRAQAAARDALTLRLAAPAASAADLVRACAHCNGPEIRRLSAEFAGEAMGRYFPLILSPWFIFGVGAGLSPEEVRAAKEGAMPPGLSLQDVGKFLEGLHGSGGNMLGVLHSMGYTKGLLNDLGHPERSRLKSFVHYATLGLGSHVDEKGVLHPPSMLRRLHASCSEANVDVLQAAIALLNVVLPAYYSIRLPAAISGLRDLFVEAATYALRVLESSVGIEGYLVSKPEAEAEARANGHAAEAASVSAPAEAKPQGNGEAHAEDAGRPAPAAPSDGGAAAGGDEGASASQGAGVQQGETAAAGGGGEQQQVHQNGRHLANGTAESPASEKGEEPAGAATASGAPVGS